MMSYLNVFIYISVSHIALQYDECSRIEAKPSLTIGQSGTKDGMTPYMRW